MVRPSILGNIQFCILLHTHRDIAGCARCDIFDGLSSRTTPHTQSVVLCLAGSAVLCLALVLVLLNTHLLVMGFAVWRRDIFPLDVTLRFLQLLLEVVDHPVPYLSEEASAGRHHKQCYVEKLHVGTKEVENDLVIF